MSMFCFQCEQTAGGKGCTVKGVCGKEADTANKQDDLTAELINLARAAEKRGSFSSEELSLMEEGLFATVTNVNFDDADIENIKEKVKTCVKNAGGKEIFIGEKLWKGDSDIVSLRSVLLFGLRGMAAYAHHARVLGKNDEKVDSWFFKGMAALSQNHTVDEWLGLIMEFGQINLRCMEILDEANTSAYGMPVPVKVSTNIEKGPFIVISGHDLKDLKMLLEQTENKGVNIYTHGEMLPAHAYPQLKKYKHLKGNFGTAWQNQKKEFDNLPAPVLFTTNCIMPPKDSYKDNVFTTSVVGFPGLKHIRADEKGNKDFTQITELALKLGGYKQDKKMTGINGGDVLNTGFARNAVLSAAGQIIDAVKTGAIKHFFLVGGCDGAKPGRNYYTDFVKQAPENTVILTLACGKYRFNDLDIGEINGFPRIMDMGQCNDAYSAVQVALALSKAFNTTVNDLPLTLVLSWYEQKAVCILLTLLALGIKNIYIGPSLPAFLSENVLNILIEKFNLKPVTSPETDLKAMLGK